MDLDDLDRREADRYAAQAALRDQMRLTDLVVEFRGVFSEETIGRVADESLGLLLEQASVYNFVPLLATRFTRDRLRALAQVEGRVATERPEVLFVCVHNAGRSQMAALLMTDLSSGQVHVRSAGSAPGDRIDPIVADALGEIGLDVAEAFPKPLTDEVVRAADVVITMGCGDACPVYPGKRYLDWELDDPSGQPIEVVRLIRDDIRNRVMALLGELGVSRRAAS